MYYYSCTTLHCEINISMCIDNIQCNTIGECSRIFQGDSYIAQQHKLATFRPDPDLRQARLRLSICTTVDII